MKRNNILITTLVLFFSILLSLFVLYTPMPKADETGFSTLSVTGFINDISKEPHAVGDDAHEVVREYIRDTLIDFLGAENVNEDLNYSVTDENLGDIDIDNVLATIPGKSETGILLVAHYDSRGWIGRPGELGASYGAADDGYGVGTALEIVRLFKDKDLENSIYVLFTDGEELGLYGAGFAAQDTDLMSKIGFVINLEARGVAGPAYMFETSKNNSKVIDFYRNANLPVSYSLATAVYTVMPNSTDFTKFLEVGKQGVNFAVLKGLYYYHSPFDNFTNINFSSIQHYGEQIVPLVTEFTSNAKYSDTNYFVSDSNSIFFTLLPNVFISYTELTGLILSFITLALLVGLVFILKRKEEFKILTIFKQMGYIFLSIVGVAIIGFIVSYIIAFIGKVPWSVTYVRVQHTGLPTIITMLVVIASLAFLMKKYHNSKEKQTALMIAGISINLLFAILTGFALSGASFLFFIPALIGVITLYVTTYVKCKIVKHIAFSQNIFWNALILIPILYSLFMAITVGGLLALLVILVLFLSIILPSIYQQLTLE